MDEVAIVPFKNMPGSSAQSQRLNQREEYQLQHVQKPVRLRSGQISFEANTKTLLQETNVFEDAERERAEKERIEREHSERERIEREHVSKERFGRERAALIDVEI